MINGTITNEIGKFSISSENHTTSKLEMENFSGPTIILQSQELTKGPSALQNFVVHEDSEKLKNSRPLIEETTEWIKAISVITFDIDEGQVIENIYPSDVLNAKETRFLPLLSFPDSNSLATEGFCKYVFQLSKSDEVSLSGNVQTLYGYTCFFQKKDPTSPRGYFQKSVVVVTDKLYTSFFKKLLEIISTNYFNLNDRFQGRELLQTIYESIKKWKKPLPGAKLETELLGNKLSLQIPRAFYAFHHTIDPVRPKHMIKNSIDELEQDDPMRLRFQKTPFDEKRANSLDSQKMEDEKTEEGPQEEAQDLKMILSTQNIQEGGVLQDVNILANLEADKISVLWKLWEIMLTNQPLLIISDSPARCSELVLGLISLISPIEYTGDFKPYLTVHDPSYKTIQETYEKKGIDNIVIGVTNPLFLKIFKQFPHILRIDSDYEYSIKSTQKTKNRKWLMSTNELSIQGDSTVATKLLQSKSEEASAINDTLIRKLFRSLTDAFLQTFAEYFALQKNDIKKFEAKEFMKYIEKKKFSFKYLFASSSKVVKLYSRFLNSPNFMQFLKLCQNVYFAKPAAKGP